MAHIKDWLYQRKVRGRMTGKRRLGILGDGDTKKSGETREKIQYRQGGEGQQGKKI